MQGKSYENATAVPGPEGITRRTLVHNDQAMLCHFELKKGAKIPLHQHGPSQIGYVVSGAVQFMKGSEDNTFTVRTGDSYVFGPDEPHGAVALEDTVFIEVFAPSRPEYA